MSTRLPRVNQLIKKELSQIIQREIDFSSDVLVTLTRVDTEPDLEEAKVYISVLPKGEEETVLRILKKTIYQLQQKLNQRLKMRPIPRIYFVLERETAKTGRIEEILEGLKKEKK